MEDIAGGTLSRLAAFTTDPSGGNPAGVWIGPVHPDDSVMQAIAAEVGFSETAFLAPAEVRTFFDRMLDYFARERDLRGFDATRGWMHSVAHTSDALKFLARNPKLAAGADAYVAKPFSPRQLLATIRKFLPETAG